MPLSILKKVGRSTLNALEYIHRAAERGLYEIRGLGAKRKLRLLMTWFPDCFALAVSLEVIVKERDQDDSWNPLRKKPIELAIPITIAGMSFGALSARSKEAIGRAATAVGTSTTTGDGGMTAEERDSSKTLVYQCLPSRYGFNPDDLRKADAYRSRGRAGREAGRWRRFAGTKNQSESRRDARLCLRVSTSALRAAIPTGRAAMT